MQAKPSRDIAALMLVARSVGTSLQLGSQLKLVVDQLRSLMGLYEAMVMLVDGEQLIIQAYSGPLDMAAVLRSRLPLAHMPGVAETLETRDPLFLHNLHDGSAMSTEVLAFVNRSEKIGAAWSAKSAIFIPMVVRESLVGVLACDHTATGFFDESDPYQIGLLHAFASLAALACNNVQLGQRAQALALIEERARLARELHDSVSQALYGLQLGVRTARAHLPANPDKAVLAMDYVLPLSEGALSEMRALIFELRPESLEKEGLVAVLEKMARAILLRNQIVVTVDAAGYEDARLTPEQKFALQRIAQEALHNMVKHAQCKTALVRLRTQPGEATVEISDEGRGFDTEASFPGHYGLTGMRERAEALFGSLDIASVPGKGTRIFARLPIY